jgi:murein DD-endopeptidase MepM/ murein hydrolase activator NlpD
VRLVFFLRRDAGASRVDVSGPLAFGVTGIAVVLLVVGAFFAGLHLGSRSESLSAGSPTELARAALQQRAEVEAMRQRVQERVDSIAARIGQVNGHILRLDALGRRLVELTDLHSHEFSFDTLPGIGGPESADAISGEMPDVTRMLDSLESKLAQRETQLGVLESLILQRDLRRQMQPEGRPVVRGFLSSLFGMRQDPLSGQIEFHRGIDFAGEPGEPVLAVGAGVVTFSGERPGYGKVVDVTHGDGYVTRYAHNQRLLVRVGDTVRRGQPLARLGSTGRSTGPHVHFEVLRNGRHVNPLSYIDG